MHKVIAQAMAALLTLALTGAGATKTAIANEGTKQIFASLQASTVYVEVQATAGTVIGSGVVVNVGSGSQVLTCAHLLSHGVAPVSAAITIYAVGDGDKNEWQKVQATVARIDGARDLALLNLTGKFSRLPIPIALVQPETFSDVFLYTNPSIAAGTASLGILSRKRYHSIRSSATYYQITSFSWPGSSGGPVADQWGRLIGIVGLIGKEEADGTIVPNVVYAADLKTVRDFLSGKP